MKRIISLVLLLLISFNCLSQNNEIEDDNRYVRLLRDLRNSDTDIDSMQAFIELGNYNKFSRPDSGIYFTLQGLMLARDTGDRDWELMALQNLASAYETIGNSITAYRVSLEGLRKAEEYNSASKGVFLMQLGTEMLSSLKYKEAKDYYKKAIDEFQKIDNQNYLATSTVLLGIAHSRFGKIDSAMYYAHRAKQLNESNKISWALEPVYSGIGDIHWNCQNADSALYYFKLSGSKSFGETRSAALSLKIAHTYMAKGQSDSVLSYAEQAMDVALSNKLYQLVTETATLLSGVFEESDPAKAISYSNMALAYKDSLEIISKMTGFSDMVNFDELQRKAEVERNKQEYQSRLRTNSFLGGIVILLIIASFLFRNNRIKHKAKLEIEGAYNKLKSTQTQLIHAEKMASLGELTAGIAHEIQNPLNFVNNFSELNNELIDEQLEEIEKGDLEEIKELALIMKENGGKINHHGKRADAIVKGMLAHSRTGKGEKEPTDINELADEFLRLSYHGLQAKDKNFNADFKTDFDPDLPKINVIPQDIGRVLLNLVNNAFQACTESDRSACTSAPLSARDEASRTVHEEVESPLVKVSTKQTDHGVQITVLDNGTGIPDNIKDKIFQPFFTTKPTGQGTGLGLSLSYDIVKAHGGTLKVDSSLEQGTRFTIELPKS